jgi:hypothetical protein
LLEEKVDAQAKGRPRFSMRRSGVRRAGRDFGFGKRTRTRFWARVSTLPDYALSGVKAQAFVRFLFFFMDLIQLYHEIMAIS